MRIGRAAALIFLPLMIAGCYSSKLPLIPAGKAVFPYQKIVYQEPGATNATTFVHEGNAYVSQTEQGDHVQMLFMPLKDNLYVVQVGGNVDGNGKVVYLYGLLKLDLPNKMAASYVAVADKSDIGPGLPACTDADSTICLTDLKPYLDHALALMAAGAEPMTTYKLLDLE